MWQLYDLWFTEFWSFFTHPHKSIPSFPVSGMSRIFSTGVTAKMKYLDRSCLHPSKAGLLSWLNLHQHLLQYCRLMSTKLKHKHLSPISRMNYTCTQTFPPAIPTWCSYLWVNQISYQRWLKGRGSVFVCAYVQNECEDLTTFHHHHMFLDLDVNVSGLFNLTT